MRITILKKSIGVIDNPLVEAILNQDDDALEDLIDDEHRDGSAYIYQGRVIIQVDELFGDAEDVDRTIDQYRMEGNNGWEWVHSDIENRYYDREDYEGDLEVIFKSYYDKNKIILQQELGIISYEQFKEKYSDNYFENEYPLSNVLNY